MCQIEKLQTWKAFKNRLEEHYLDSEHKLRQQFFFRGHADSRWELKPTIDRLSKTFSSDEGREQFLDSLIRMFREECHGLIMPGQDEQAREHWEWEFLGRHHGLPTTILDWTQSPYAAAYFAFEEAQGAEWVSVWVLDRSGLDFDQIDGLAWKSFDEAVRFNIRAAEQRGASMQVKTTEQTVEDLLGKRLIRLDIRASERRTAIIDLDEMQINRRTLCRDLDGAATTAALRLGAK
jgi:hypothetical protein